VRVLLMDASPVTAWLMRRLLPMGAEIEWVQDFSAAERALKERGFDGALFGLAATQPPWFRLTELCRNRVPGIPYLCYYSLRVLPGDTLELDGAYSGTDRPLLHEFEERLEGFIGQIKENMARGPARRSPA